MRVVRWTGFWPSGNGAGCAALTSAMFAWASLTWACWACWVASNACTCASSWATRASSSFSLAVAATAMPGASSATSIATTKGFRIIDAVCADMIPSPG